MEEPIVYDLVQSRIDDVAENGQRDIADRGEVEDSLPLDHDGLLGEGDSA